MWRYCVNIWRRRVGGPGRWWSCNGLTRSNSRPCEEALLLTRSTIPNENTTVDSSARLDTLSNICSKTPRSQNILQAELATGFTQQWFKCVSDNWKRMFHPMQMQKSNGSPLQSTCIPLASRRTLGSHVASVCRRWRHKVLITTSDKQLKQSRQYCCVCFQASKPLMEKRRRERINNCLDQLKAILMDVTKKEVWVHVNLTWHCDISLSFVIWHNFGTHYSRLG